MIKFIPENNNATVFKNLKLGDFFYYGSDVCMKILLAHGPNAVNLSTPESTYIAPEQKVVKFFGTIKITNE